MTVLWQMSFYAAYLENLSLIHISIQCQFDCKLKRVVKGIVRNYRKELKRRRNKEISYCELPEIVVEKLAVWDEYESDYTAFDVCGIEAVSYTHLDVYKRQVRGGTLPYPAFTFGDGGSCDGACRRYPVSYTHL